MSSNRTIRPAGTIVATSTADLAAVRRGVRSFLTPLLSPQRVDDAVLVASELVTNGLEHGHGESVQLCLDRDHAAAYVTVRSDSEEFPQPRQRTVPVDMVNGRGLAIVAALSNKVNITGEDGGVLIKCRFDRPSATDTTS